MNFKKRTIADLCKVPSESAPVVEDVAEEEKVVEAVEEPSTVGAPVAEEVPMIEEVEEEPVVVPKRAPPAPPVKVKQPPLKEEIVDELEEDDEAEDDEEEHSNIEPSGQVTIDAEEYKRLRASQRLCGTDEELESWDWTSLLWLGGGLLALKFLKKN